MALSTMAACTRTLLRVSLGSRNVVSKPATPNVAMSRRMRATALSIPRPAAEESSGMNGEPGEPGCPTPYVMWWSAS